MLHLLKVCAAGSAQERPIKYEGQLLGVEPIQLGQIWNYRGWHEVQVQAGILGSAVRVRGPLEGG